MNLGDFIRASMDLILDEWTAFARQIPSARDFEQNQLRDHARGILGVIADDLERAQTPAEQQEKSQGRGPRAAAATEAELHGSVRLAEGFTINDAMAEFRALRATVLRLWSAHAGAGHDVAADMTRFNEAVDQALSESLARYSELRDRQSRLFDALLSTSPDLNFIIEPGGIIIYANKAAGARFGKSPGEMHGADFFTLCAPFAPEMALHVRHVVNTRSTYRGELPFAPETGKHRTYEYLLVPVLDPHGKCEAVAGSARDITERKAAEERVRRSANYDHLTDLPNRSLFHERLELELKHSARTGLPLALLFIDLDGFKEVNDRLGHAAGDELLQQAAHRIRACVRGTDLVSRLGGDEFTVILTDITQPPHVETLCAKILAELSKPFSLDAGEAAISGSIGITRYPGDGLSLDELLRNADAAMYDAKNAGRNQFRAYAASAAHPYA